MVTELRQSVKYVVDAHGHPSAAIIDIEVWRKLLEWLEDREDLASVREALAELDAVGGNAARAGWLRWSEVRDELGE
ncbi:MAG: hypothetical protein NZM11_12505 [Anaerolineales bacterium]|nr:hypothetical protein [Anaerolineales bacterium]